MCRYKFVFRQRLDKEDPAILPPLEVKTYPGAQLRKGYKISFDKLSDQQLKALHAELATNKGMGVIGDAPLNSILHSLLTLTKPDGSYRWMYNRERDHGRLLVGQLRHNNVTTTTDARCKILLACRSIQRILAG